MLLLGNHCRSVLRTCVHLLRYRICYIACFPNTHRARINAESLRNNRRLFTGMQRRDCLRFAGRWHAFARHYGTTCRMSASRSRLPPWSYWQIMRYAVPTTKPLIVFVV